MIWVSNPRKCSNNSTIGNATWTCSETNFERSSSYLCRQRLFPNWLWFSILKIKWYFKDFINGLTWQWDSGLSPSGSGYKSVAGEYSNREWSGVESSSSRLTTRKGFRGEKLWKSEVNPTLDKIMLSLNQNSNSQVTNGNLNGFKSLKGFKTFHFRGGKKLSQLGCEQNE